MQVGGKQRGRVKVPGGNRLPGLPCQDGGIEFPLPEHVERLPWLSSSMHDSRTSVLSSGVVGATVSSTR